MEQKDITYLEKQTEASLSYEDGKVDISLHKAKIKLQDELEIHLLKSVNPEFNKEFTLTEDLLKISIFPPETYSFFKEIFSKNTQSKWRFAYNLLQKIQNHSLNRLKQIVCPENIMFDQGLQPHFLHYGVKESIPPYEDDKNRLWGETKAIMATIVDEKYDFEMYLSHHETITLSPITSQIMGADTFEQLYEIIDENLKNDAAYEKTVIPIPVKKWKFRRYLILGLSIFLIPALIYTFFAAFFKIPETEAYVQSNRYFLQNQYSEVINTLEKYNHRKMPYGVQYQLASSYVINESLLDEQKEVVQNTITLQSDRKYFLYWIDIGRGNYQEAIDTARLLEDRELIMYGLIQQAEAVKADTSLSGAEREEALKPIDDELEAYQQEKEEERKEKEEQEKEAQNKSEAAESVETSTKTVETEEDKTNDTGTEKDSDNKSETDNKDNASNEKDNE